MKCYIKEEKDCDACKYSYMYHGDIEACNRKDSGLDCRYEERLKRTCPTCEKEVYADEMCFTKDCHGIPFRKVCHICYMKIMEKGYDGEYYTEADEQIDEDY